MFLATFHFRGGHAFVFFSYICNRLVKQSPAQPVLKTGYGQYPVFFYIILSFN